MENFKNCVFYHDIASIHQQTFRSHKHEIFTERIHKIVLDPFDDKRYICEDGIHTLPFGHKNIKEVNE